jgi:hypothetical protein
LDLVPVDQAERKDGLTAINQGMVAPVEPAALQPTGLPDDEQGVMLGYGRAMEKNATCATSADVYKSSIGPDRKHLPATHPADYL